MSEQKKRWTYDQEIAYEMAMNYINEIQGLLSRQKALFNDEDKRDVYLKRISEFFKEESLLDGFNDAMIKDVIDTYSELIIEYGEMFRRGEGIKSKELPEKFLTTKVDYAKYEK